MRARDAFAAIAVRPLELGNGLCLAEFAGSTADRRLERLAEDKELVETLVWRGYRGADWIAFRRALAEYGYQVVLAWCLSGKIFVECARKGFGAIRRPPRPIDHDDATELACETVAASLVYFRDRVLVPRSWDPARGASLKTFFVGACVLVFANVTGDGRLKMEGFCSRRTISAYRRQFQVVRSLRVMCVVFSQA